MSEYTDNMLKQLLQATRAAKNVKILTADGLGISATNPLPVYVLSGGGGGGGGLTDIQLRATPVPMVLTTGGAVIGSISNTSFGISGTLPAFTSTPTFNIGTAPTIAVTGAFFQATQPVSGTFWQATQPISGTVSVTGVATAANQTTMQTTLSSIDTKTPALGQALAAASVPIVLTVAQLATLTPPAAITGYALDSSLTTLHNDLIAATPAGANVIGKVDLNNTALISTVNSSSATLASNGVFTGTSEDISQYSEVRVTVFSDVASATDGLQMQQSINGTNWDTLDVYSIPAGTSKTFGVGSSSQFFRLVYTNGVTLQSSFRLQTTYKKLRTKPSSIRPQDARTNDNDMEEIVAYTSIYNGTSWDRLRGDTTNGAYVQQRDLLATGTITTQNLNATGVGTTNSYVGYTALNNKSTVVIQVVGTYTGALTPQISQDGTNWITLASSPLVNLATGVYSSTISSATQGAFQMGIGGYINFRIVALSAVTGTATITMQTSAVSEMITIDNPLPVGTNSIGNLGTVSTVTGVTTVTTLSNGQTAHSVAVSGSPLRIGAKVAQTTQATIDQTLVAGDASDVSISTSQQLITKDFGTAENDFTTNTSYTGLTSTGFQTTPLIIGSASNVRNYIAGITIQTDTIGAAGIVWISDYHKTVSSIATGTGLATTSVSHDYRIGDIVIFESLSGGSGVSTNTVYYVLTVPSAATFTFGLAVGGANLVPSVAYVGTTCFRVLYQLRLQTVGIVTPNTIIFPTPLRGDIAGQTMVYLPASLTSGTIYITMNGYRAF